MTPRSEVHIVYVLLSGISVGVVVVNEQSKLTILDLRHSTLLPNVAYPRTYSFDPSVSPSMSPKKPINAL